MTILRSAANPGDNALTWPGTDKRLAVPSHARFLTRANPIDRVRNLEVPMAFCFSHHSLLQAWIHASRIEGSINTINEQAASYAPHYVNRQ